MGIEKNLYPEVSGSFAQAGAKFPELYRGRTGLYELLQNTPSLRHLIRRQSSTSEYLGAGVTDGMLTLKQDGIEKVIRGVTDIMQVRGACT